MNFTDIITGLRFIMDYIPCVPSNDWILINYEGYSCQILKYGDVIRFGNEDGWNMYIVDGHINNETYITPIIFSPDPTPNVSKRLERYIGVNKIKNLRKITFKNNMSIIE